MTWIKIKSKVIEWALKSTFHAIPNVFRNDKVFVKIVWIICFLVSFGYCASLVIANLVTYLNFEVITFIEVASDSDSEFPTVTICNLNPCSYESFEDYQYNTTLKLIGLNNKDFEESINKLHFNFEQNLNFSIEEKSISKYLKICNYDGQNCNETHFKQFKLNDFKICYQFNGNKSSLKRAKKFGKRSGLRLELFVDDFEECKNDSYKGITVSIHNYTNWISDDSSTVLVRPGLETDIAFEKTLITKQPKPFSNCVKVNINQESYSEMVKKTFERTDLYNQQYCTHLCFQEFLVENLNCYDQYLPYYKNTSINACDDKKQVAKVKEDFYDKLIDKQCLNKCPVECETYTFKETLSINKYPSTVYEKALVYIIDEKNIASYTNRLVSLNIFFKSDIYTTIREDQNLEFADFISNVGGTLGLFLGVSILSLVEFIELATEIIEIFIENRKNKVQADDIQVESVE